MAGEVVFFDSVDSDDDERGGGGVDLNGFVSGFLFADGTAGGKDGTGGGVLFGRETWGADITGGGEEGNGGGPLLPLLEGIGGGPRPPLGALVIADFF